VTYHRIRSDRQSADPGGGSSSGSGNEGSLRCPGRRGCTETDATYPQYVLASSIPGRRNTNPERTHTDDQVRDDGPLFAPHAGPIRRSSCRAGSQRPGLLTLLHRPPARGAYYNRALLCGSPAERPSPSRQWASHGSTFIPPGFSNVGPTHRHRPFLFLPLFTEVPRRGRS
jgi:hypothetical protein